MSGIFKILEVISYLVSFFIENDVSKEKLSSFHTLVYTS